MRPFVILLLLCAGLPACTPSARFMNLGWESKRAEVTDTLQAKGFTYNQKKERWQDGELFGYECKRVRVWYDSLDKLAMAEAKFEEIDSVTSETIYAYLLHSTNEAFGNPDIATDERGAIPMNRRIWKLSSKGVDRNELIVLTRFNDVVIFNAARSSPEPFERAEK